MHLKIYFYILQHSDAESQCLTVAAERQIAVSFLSIHCKRKPAEAQAASTGCFNSRQCESIGQKKDPPFTVTRKGRVFLNGAGRMLAPL